MPSQAEKVVLRGDFSPDQDFTAINCNLANPYHITQLKPMHACLKNHFKAIYSRLNGFVSL